MVSRRPISKGLSRLRIARSRDDDGFEGSEEDWEEEAEDVEEEGKQLFYNFVHDQMETETPEAARDIQIL